MHESSQLCEVKYVKQEVIYSIISSIVSVALVSDHREIRKNGKKEKSCRSSARRNL